MKLQYRNRSIRLTSEGLLFLFMTLLVGSAAIHTGNNLLYLLMALMLTLIMISGILSEWCLRKIRLEYRIASPLIAHDPTACRWIVHNMKSLFPSLALKAWVQYPDMASNPGVLFSQVWPNSSLFINSTLTFGRRGIFRPKGCTLSTTFPFGFFEKTVIIPTSQEVVVYPRLHPLWLGLGGSDRQGEDRASGKRGRGSTLHTLRAYQAGDDARNIHWKVSARRARPFVKEFEKEEDRKVQVWLINQLPASPSPEKTQAFEEAVSIAASLVYAFTQRRYAVGLSTLDREVPPGQGMVHCHRLLHHLALVKPLPAAGSLEKTADRLERQPSLKALQSFLVLPWEDPFWKARGAYFTKIITPADWRLIQERGQVP